MKHDEARTHIQPKILFLDIETAPNTAYVWGLFDQNISHEHVEEAGYILCWAAKWAHEETVRYSSIHKTSMKRMLKEIHSMLDEADVVIHYNGLKFDIPTLNKEFIKHDFTPPSPYKQVDMLKVCRQAFRFESNKLDAVLKSLDLGAKVQHRGFQLWIGCMKGDQDCWEEMERYNKHDVVGLQSLYQKVLPWIDKHPNLAAYKDKPACTNCGSTLVQRRGWSLAVSKWYPRYQCQSCGHWFKGAAQKEKGHGASGAKVRDKLG